jgi:hypothetical protein
VLRGGTGRATRRAADAQRYLDKKQEKRKRHSPS